MITIEKNKISYVYSGLFITESVWIHPKRKESTYEIICVMEGTIFLEENGIQHKLHKGDIIILKPNIEHKGFCESTGKTSFYWIHFYAENFSEFQISQTIINDYTNIALFKQILHMANTPNYPGYCIDAALVLLLGEFAQLLNQKTFGEYKVVREAAEWIRINSMQKLTVREIALRYGYSSEHFSRIFRNVFLMGMKEYICNERIKKACDILCNTSYSVKQIAYMMGYDDENQFVHFFKYHQGLSPARYRNKNFSIHMNQQ